MLVAHRTSLLLLVWQLNQLHCRKLSEYHVVSGLQGKQCKPEDTVFNRSLGESLLCILMCFDSDGCLGVFFSKGAAACVGCSQFYSDGSGLGEAAGDTIACFDTAYGSPMPGTTVYTSSDSFTENARVNHDNNGSHLHASFEESEIDKTKYVTFTSTTLPEMKKTVSSTKATVKTSLALLNRTVWAGNGTSSKSDISTNQKQIGPTEFGSIIYLTSVNDNFIGLTSIKTGRLSISKTYSSIHRTASMEPSTNGTTNVDIFITTNVTNEQGLSSTSERNKDLFISGYFSNRVMTDFTNAGSYSPPPEESFVISTADSGISSITDVRYVSGTFSDLAPSKGSSRQDATDFDLITNTSFNKEKLLISTTRSAEILQPQATNISEDTSVNQLSAEETVTNRQKPSLTSNYLNFSSYAPIFSTVEMTGSNALGETIAIVKQSINTTSILPDPVKKGPYSESIPRIEKTTNHFYSLFSEIPLSRHVNIKSVTRPSDTFPTIYPSFYTYTPKTQEAGTGMRSLTGDDISSKDYTEVSKTSINMNDLNPSNEYPPVGQGYWPMFWYEYETSRYHSATYLRNFLDYCEYLAVYDDTYYRFLGCNLSSRGASL